MGTRWFIDLTGSSPEQIEHDDDDGKRGLSGSLLPTLNMFRFQISRSNKISLS